MMRPWSFVLVGLAQLACSRAESLPPQPSAEAAASASAAAEEPLSLERYDRVLLSLAPCAVKELPVAEVDPKCPEWQAHMKLVLAGDGKLYQEQVARVPHALIDHEAPAVRLMAIRNLASANQPTSPVMKRFAARAQVEQDPAVAKVLIGVLAAGAVTDPQVREQILGFTRHQNPNLRKSAVEALGQPEHRAYPAVADRLLERIEQDPAPQVRAAACESAGILGEERFVAVFERLTTPETPPEVASGCAIGLVLAWADGRSWKTSNEAAYRLTVKLLTRKPRSASSPSISSYVAEAAKGSGPDFEAWRARWKWVKPAELRRALLDVAADPNASEANRALSIGAADAFGATKAELQALERKITPEQTFLASELERALAGK